MRRDRVDRDFGPLPERVEHGLDDGPRRRRAAAMAAETVGDHPATGGARMEEVGVVLVGLAPGRARQGGDIEIRGGASGTPLVRHVTFSSAAGLSCADGCASDRRWMPIV